MKPATESAASTTLLISASFQRNSVLAALVALGITVAVRLLFRALGMPLPEGPLGV